MEDYILALDEYFCAQYSDYVRISAIEGYKMPEVIYVAEDGNVARRDSACMRLKYQENREGILKTLKQGLADTDFTFSFCFIPFREKIHARFSKFTFSKILPEALRHSGETVESAGEKLDIEPRFWDLIVKGKIWPEKNTILALALVCRMQLQDVINLFNVRGFSFSDESVRDIVVQYLITHKIFNEEMRDRCLKEYSIENLPIRREK